MRDAPERPDPAYHLFSGLMMRRWRRQRCAFLISDEAHQPEIRQLARKVLAGLEAVPDEGDQLVVALSPGQMKIIQSAVRLLLDDLQREQVVERATLRRILDKLPDEHSIRAIVL